MGKNESSEAWSDTKVGLVALVALIIIILGIAFAGGDKGLFFQKKSEVTALLPNIGGLKKGSAVMVGGMAVGRVVKMEFIGTNARQIQVTMEMRQDVRQKIKIDSVPSVRTQGMLGDRYMDISAGSENAQVLPEGQVLSGQAAAAFDETLERAVTVMDKTNQILTSINEQKGTIGKLFYDDKFYANLIKITDEINEFMRDFKQNPRKYIKFSVF